MVPQLVDRHIVAFVATRGGTGIQRDIAVIADARNNARCAKVAMATLLARIQMEHGPASLPALSKWIAEELAGVVAQLGSKATRQAVSRSLEAVAPLGNLATVAACVDDVKVCQRDDRGRTAAAKEYADAGREIARLESRQMGREAQRLGWRIASTISATIAITCVVSLLVF